VTMTNGFSFSPATVRLPVGGTIEWRNTSIATHTVTDDPARVGDEASLPAGVEPFSSGSIPPGQVWRHTFAVPGRYDYVCLPHHDLFGMRGTVEVQP
jgi:plastocyanin